MKMRVADYIAQYLEDLGVGHVFLLSGGGMMHLLDAVARRKTLRYVCSHHEQSSAFAADAYARLKGGLGVCFGTSGPGGTNTLTGVVSAWQDSIPVLFISGQAKLSETIRGSKLFGLRQFGTFEVDIVPMVQSVTKYAAFLDDPKMIRYHLEKAVKLALSGRPGPVFIDIPVDLQGALIEPETLPGYDEELSTAPPLDVAAVSRLSERLAEAKRPLILAGHGVRAGGATELFRRVVKKLNLPVATTQLASDLMPASDPLFIGHPGVKGDRAGNLAVQNADLIVTIGCSLHSMTTGYELKLFAPDAYKVQVELDELVLKREQVGVNEKIQACVKTFLKQLEETARPVAAGEWHELCRRAKTELAVRNEPHKRAEDKINYYDVIFGLNDLCNGDETIIADSGSAFYVTGQAFAPKEHQRVLISGALGQMGYTLPAVVGACFAAPGRNAIGITGDGSFQTAVHDLAVMSHHKLQAKVIVVNNGGYTSIRNTQNNYFGGFLAGVDHESGVFLPDNRKIADAYGVAYLSARTQTELKANLKAALDAKGPVLLEVFTPSQQEILPTITSVRLENGRMQSKPLHEMFPFLPPETLEKYLCKKGGSGGAP